MKQIQKTPEILADVSIPCPDWNNDERRPATLATKAVKETIACALLPVEIKEAGTLEISILLANDDLVRALNREYREIDKATNVLSFPQFEFSQIQSEAERKPVNYEGPVNLGDLVLAFETVKKEADDKIISFESHFFHLIIHGTLHLLGYNHVDEDDAALMEDTEIWIMSRMGYKNPYT
jgi:probable rRNA maturation factor